MTLGRGKGAEQELRVCVLSYRRFGFTMSTNLYDTHLLVVKGVPASFSPIFFFNFLPFPNERG